MAELAPTPKEKELATRAELGPRLRRGERAERRVTAEPSPMVRFRTRGAIRSHPSRDSA